MSQAWKSKSNAGDEMTSMKMARQCYKGKLTMPLPANLSMWQLWRQPHGWRLSQERHRKQKVLDSWIPLATFYRKQSKQISGSEKEESNFQECSFGGCFPSKVKKQFRLFSIQTKYPEAISPQTSVHRLLSNPESPKPNSLAWSLPWAGCRRTIMTDNNNPTRTRDGAVLKNIASKLPVLQSSHGKNLMSSMVQMRNKIITRD